MSIEENIKRINDRTYDIDDRLTQLERMMRVQFLRGLSYEQIANAVIHDHASAEDLRAFMEIHYGKAPVLRHGSFVLDQGTDAACVRFLEEINSYGAGVLISKG